MADYAAGKSIPPKLINPDREFTAQNAKDLLPTAY